jgi:hypothetical protein
MKDFLYRGGSKWNQSIGWENKNKANKLTEQTLAIDPL